MHHARPLLALSAALVVAGAIGAGCGSFTGSDAPRDAASDGATDLDGGATDASVQGQDADGGGPAAALPPCDGGVLAFSDDLSGGGNWAASPGAPLNCGSAATIGYSAAGATIECDGPSGSYNTIISPALPSGATSLELQVTLFSSDPTGATMPHVFAQLLSLFGPTENLSLTYDPNSGVVTASNGSGPVAKWTSVSPNVPHTVRLWLPAEGASGTTAIEIDGTTGTATPIASRGKSGLQIGPYLNAVAGSGKDRYTGVRFWSCP